MPFNHEIHEILSCDEIYSPVKLQIRDVGSPDLLAEPGLIPEDGSLAIPFNSDDWILSTSRLKHLHATHSFASIWLLLPTGRIITPRALTSPSD